MHLIKLTAHFKCGHSRVVLNAEINQLYTLPSLIEDIQFDNPDVVRITADIALPEKETTSDDEVPF